MMDRKHSLYSSNQGVDATKTEYTAIVIIMLSDINKISLTMISRIVSDYKTITISFSYKLNCINAKTNDCIKFFLVLARLIFFSTTLESM